MIYLWRIPSRWPNKLIGGYDHDRSPNYLLFSNGRKIKDEELKKNFDKEEIDSPPIVKFKVPKARILQCDCLPNSGSAPLVNERLKQLLEKLAPDDVQFIPAILKCADGDLEGYYFLNVTHTIKGLDHTQSKYSYIGGTDAILGFKYATYQSGCMGKYDLARDAEYLGHLLVSDKIKKIFDEEEITGVRLVRPEDYYHSITAQDLINAENAE